MEIKDLIARINFLYKKSQEQGLSESEKEEQKTLRKHYINIIKGNVREQLNKVKKIWSVYIINCRNGGDAEWKSIVDWKR